MTHYSYCPQVSRTFRKLQAAAITDPQDAAAVAAATAAEPTSLVNLAPAAFPIFTTTRQWLKLLDARQVSMLSSRSSSSD